MIIKVNENIKETNYNIKSGTINFKENINNLEPIILNLNNYVGNKIYINIDRNSSLKLMLELKENNNKDFQININIEENSNLEYLLLTEMENKIKLNNIINIEKNSTLEFFSGYINKDIRVNNNIDLKGENSNVKVNSIIISGKDDSQQIDFKIEHNAPYSFADMQNVGVATENGRVVMNGVAKIYKNNKQSNAFQSLRGIINSDDAFMEVNPILLIDEHDIKAGHGATIGKVEFEPLYYLMSRGIEKDKAEKMIIMGFLDPVISKIDNDEIKDHFTKMVNNKL